MAERSGGPRSGRKLNAPAHMGARASACGRQASGRQAGGRKRAANQAGRPLPGQLQHKQGTQAQARPNTRPKPKIKLNAPAHSRTSAKSNAPDRAEGTGGPPVELCGFRRRKIFLGKGSKNRFPGPGPGHKWGVKNAKKSEKRAAPDTKPGRRRGGAGRAGTGGGRRREKERKKAPCIKHGAGGYSSSPVSHSMETERTREKITSSKSATRRLPVSIRLIAIWPIWRPLSYILIASSSCVRPAPKRHWRILSPDILHLFPSRV